MRVQTRLAILCVGALVALLAGCASAPKAPEPTRAAITVRVGAGANPDPSGRDLPVVVRLFQINAPGAFEQADFFELLDKSPSLAVDGYAVLDEIETVSGTERSSQHELDPAARYVGAMAAFRSIDQAKWKAFAPIVPQKMNEVTVEVSRHDVKVDSRPAGR